MMSRNPKIEFIDFYVSDHDVKGGGESAFTEAIMGRAQPIPLFLRPFNVAADARRGVVYVADHGRHKVWVLDLANYEIRTLRNNERQPQLFQVPIGLAVGPEGGVFVGDSAGGKIVFFDKDGIKRREVLSDRMVRPTGMAYDPVSDHLYVADAGQHQVLLFDGDGTFLRALGERGRAPGRFNYPTDVDVTDDGYVVVLDALNARIQVFTPDGEFLRAFGERGTALGSFALAKGLAVDEADHVYVTDALSHKVVVFSLDGEYLLTLGGKHVVSDQGGVAPGGFYLPQGIDIDDSGGIWICDTFNKAVYKFQYLNERYLQENPIQPADIYAVPESELRGSAK